jgi:hypothetical protein
LSPRCGDFLGLDLTGFLRSRFVIVLCPHQVRDENVPISGE